MRATLPCLLLASSLVGTAAPHDPAEAAANLDVHDALTATLFASEPMMRSPSSIDIDHRGRVWLCEVVNYRRHNGKRPEGDRILILEDSNGDNKADRSVVFHQGRDVDSAHGICVLGNRAIVSAGDDVFSLIDDDGDDKADRKEMMFTKIGGRQHDHGIHAFHFGPDGKLYFNFGNSGRQLCDKDGKVIVDLAGNEVVTNRNPYQQGMIFRCDLDGSNVESLAWNFRNNWEVSVDSFGRLWQSDNDDDGNRGVRINYVLPYGNYGYRDEITGGGWRDARPNIEKETPRRHWHLNDPGVVPNLLLTGAGSPTGICLYEGSLLPKEFTGQPIHCDAGPNVVRAYVTTKNGAGFDAGITNILSGSRNRWFRPSDVCVAPDGALIVADWYDPGVGGHGMGDLERGRLFLVAPKGHQYSASTLDLASAAGALAALDSPNEATRYLAYTAIEKMPADLILPVLRARFADPAAPAHLRARAFWALRNRSTGKQRDSAILAALVDRDPLIRIAGIQACGLDGPDKDNDPLIAQVTGSDPQVTAFAAIALRFSDRPAGDAAWAKLAASYQGGDRWLLEALGIGADLHWPTRFAAYLVETGDKPHPDLVWRARCDTALPYLAKQIVGADSAQRDRYLRALHFHAESSAIQQFALDLFRNGSPELAAMAALEMLEDDTIRQGGDVKRLEELTLARKGTTDLVKLATRFNQQSDAVLAALLEFIMAHRSDNEGAEAARHLLAQPGLLERSLASGDLAERQALATALGRSGDKRALAHLQQSLERAADTVTRRACVEALAVTPQGQKRLVEMAKNGTLPDDVKFVTGALLARSSNEGIRREIATVLRLPVAPGADALPPLSQLLRLKGQPAKGKAAFTKATCATCHQVGTEGTNYGPNLSEIGSKLPKEALFEAILYPSNAVAHGYAGVQLETASGDQVVGFLTSETDQKVTVRMAGGFTRDLKPGEIRSRKELEQSLMPPGLAGLLHPLELADLVAYLESLKK